MELIGMLDSPYVRRVAITLHQLGVPFDHRPLSVFRPFDEFSKINPVVRAPSLVCDDGVVLMDSTLILDYVETLAGRSLMPADLKARRHVLRILGLALTACEKAAQVIVERALRPPEKQHEPYIERVTTQLATAFALLEAELKVQPLSADERSIDQAGITTAVAWRFALMKLPTVIAAADYPLLGTHSEQAERLRAFKSAPP